MVRPRRTLIVSLLVLTGAAGGVLAAAPIGSEVALGRHLAPGEEQALPLRDLLVHGQRVFSANWTVQEGGGRPLTKGTGALLTDATAPLVFPRNFNRISAPDANSCAGCHNAPFGVAGGGGDITTNVFVLGQRFDFATFDGNQSTPTVASHDELGRAVTLEELANSRATLGMFGAGYIEMLARQMTNDLQALRDGLAPGQERTLTASGISFGVLARAADGTWDTSRVEGLPAPSLASSGPSTPPSLIVRPFHQAGAVISIRQFTNNAMNHHHGIQPVERFGADLDPDGDGFRNELTRADVTAATLYQATLPVPGRVIPRDPTIEAAVRTGERHFQAIGCSGCHIPELPLRSDGRFFVEPNPFNPSGNLRPGEAPNVVVNLNSPTLPLPRLRLRGGITWVPAYTDLKLHDITSGPGDPNREALDMNQPAGSSGFFAGNARFLTRKLWGAANEPPYFHHGKFTTLREAVLAHAGEAQAVTDRFRGMSSADQDAVIEFLKTLQVLPPGTKSLVVDELGRARSWP